MSALKRIRVEHGLYKRGKVNSACVTPEGSPLWRTLGEVNLMEARRLRDEFASEVRGGKVVRGKETFGDVGALWQAEQKALVAVGELRNSTYRRYEGCLRLHVLPTFEKRPVQKITPDDLVKWHHGRKEAKCASAQTRLSVTNG